VEIPVITLKGPLEDLHTLLSDQPLGSSLDFEIDVEPPVVDDTPQAVTTTEYRLSSLEPLTIWFVLRELFGTKWWELECAAMVDVLDDRFTITKPDRDLIYSLQMLETGNAFWHEWEVFNWLCQGLVGDGTDFVNFPVLTPMQMAEAMMIAHMIERARHGDKEEVVEDFASEVCQYAAVTCCEDGLWVLPEPLSEFQTCVNTLLERKHLDIPYEQAESIRVADSPPPDAELKVQWERCRAITDELARALKESMREIRSWKRIDK
jgi:hypothetical protein